MRPRTSASGSSATATNRSCVAGPGAFSHSSKRRALPPAWQAAAGSAPGSKCSVWQTLAWNSAAGASAATTSVQSSSLSSGKE